MKIAQTLLVSALVVSVAGCAQDPNRNAKRGAGGGAVLGAVIGNQVSHGKGAPIIGAVVGALAGAAVGNYMDKQRKEVEQQMAPEIARGELNTTTLSDGSLKVAIASDVSFDLGSATMRPGALDAYARVAAILKNYDKTVIHVVGHTDTSGANDYNQGLSDRRAAAVGTYLASQGVPGARIREEGRGEREPVVRTADNIKEARNRRVDIVIKPVVEGNEQAAWVPPPYLGG